MSDERQQVQAEVRDFIIDNFLFGAADELTDGASLLEGGVIDSTGVLELVGFLESSYGIEVSDTELVPENLDSVEAISGYVARKQA